MQFKKTLYDFAGVNLRAYPFKYAYTPGSVLLTMNTLSSNVIKFPVVIKEVNTRCHVFDFKPVTFVFG